MKRLFVAFSACLLLMLPAAAEVVGGFVSSSDDNKLTFKVDSIDYRSDLTRVYGRLLGVPHTSQRIDGVKFVGNGSVADATDIDGVDFRRYFQWEDDGEIPVEIDFPRIKKSPGLQIVFQTAVGSSTTTAKKISGKR